MRCRQPGTALPGGELVAIAGPTGAQLEYLAARGELGQRTPRVRVERQIAGQLRQGRQIEFAGAEFAVRRLVAAALAPAELQIHRLELQIVAGRQRQLARADVETFARQLGRNAAVQRDQIDHRQVVAQPQLHVVERDIGGDAGQPLAGDLGPQPHAAPSCGRSTG